MYDLNNIKWNLVEGSNDVNSIYEVVVQYEEFSKWSKTKKFDGFRAGKAPLTEENQQSFLNSIVNFIFPQIKKDNLFSVNYSLKYFKENEPIEFNMTIESMPNMPEIKLNNYKIKKYDFSINEEDIKRVIEGYSLLESNKNPKASTEPAKIGDFLNLEIEDLSNNQKTFKEIKLGKLTLNPDIEKQLENQKTGFSLEYKVNDNLKFNIKILEVNKAIKLKNEEIAEKLKVEASEVENTFKKDLEDAGNSIARKLLNDTLFKIIAETQFNVPLSLIHKEFKSIYSQALYDLKYTDKMNLADLVKTKLNLTLEEFEKNLQNSAIFASKLKFFFDFYAFKNNMQVTEEEISHLIKARSTYFKNGLKEALKFFNENEEEKKNLVDQYLHPKIIDKLTSELTIKETIILSLDELQKININDLTYEVSE